MDVQETDGTIYVGSTDCNVYAINAANGKIPSPKVRTTVLRAQAPSCYFPIHSPMRNWDAVKLRQP